MPSPWSSRAARIVFSNCSLDPLEGEALHRAFLSGTAEIVDDPRQTGEIAGIDPFLTPQGTLRTTPADMELEFTGSFRPGRLLRRPHAQSRLRTQS